MPLPSAEVPLDRSGAYAVVRQLARTLGRLPSLDDYEEWIARRRDHRPELLSADGLLATAGVSDWDTLCERVQGG